MKIPLNLLLARLWLAFAMVFLVSCGGGGGGGGTEPISYAGINTPAELPADGSKSAAVVADFIDMGNTLRTDMNAGALAAPPVLSGPLKTKFSAAFKKTQKAQFTKRTMAEVVTYPLACETGSGSITFDIDPVTLQGVETLKYSKCAAEGVVLNGSVITEILETSNSKYTSLRINYDFRIAYSDGSVTTVGTQTQKYTDGKVSEGSLNMLTQIDPLGVQIQYKNIQLGNGVITGQIYRNTLGYITINTPVALDVGHVDNNGISAPLGIITLTGKDDAKISMQIEKVPVGNHNLTYYMRWAMTFHVPGEAVDKYSWFGYQSTNVSTVVPYEPFISLFYPKYQNEVNTPLTFDGSYAGDANGDFLEFSWSLVSKPVGSQLSVTDSKSPYLTVTPDISGHYVFRLTVKDQDHVVEKEVHLDSYFSKVIGYPIASNDFSFDEKHQRILALVLADGVVKLGSIDLSTGQTSLTSLPQSVEDAKYIHISKNGSYLAVASYKTVVLLNADDFSELAAYDMRPMLDDYSGLIKGIKVSNSGNVYCLSRDPKNQSNTRDLVGAVEINMTSAPITTQLFTWGTEGDSYRGEYPELVAFDEVSQRIIVADLYHIRTASSTTHQQLAALQRPYPQYVEHVMYLPNTRQVVTHFGKLYDAETLSDKGYISGLGEAGGFVDTIAPYGNGAVWAGSLYNYYDADHSLFVSSPLNMPPSEWQAQWDVFDTGNFYLNVSAVKPVEVFTGSDLQHIFWIANQSVPDAPGSNNLITITKFIRH